MILIFFSVAWGLNGSMARLTSFLNLNGIFSNAISPASILEKSITALIKFSRRSIDLPVVIRSSFCSAEILVLLIESRSFLNWKIR